MSDERTLLDRGVAAGVITAAQRDALLALHEPRAEPLPESGTASRDEPPREARRAVDGVTIAYALGAALVGFALGWFLADRWRTLGPLGVLGVALAYAALFAFTATRLARAGFPIAAGVAWALATLTAPLAAWSLLRLAGEWPADDSWRNPLARYEPYMATRRLVVELSNVLAVLLLLRSSRAQRGISLTPLAVPLAVALGAALSELTTLVVFAATGDDAFTYARGWAYGTAGALLFGVAYEVDRRSHPDPDPECSEGEGEGPHSSLGPREDFAAWLYAVACLVLEFGLLDAFGLGPLARHGVAVVALAQLVAAARLRRRTLVAFGMINAIWYLGYLAFDVFKGVLSFPLLLAAFGVAVLVVTVLVQRRFPSLLRRADDSAWRPPSLPGGSLAAWVPTALATALLFTAAPRARVRAAELERQARVQRDSIHVQRQRAGRPLGPHYPSSRRTPGPQTQPH